MRTIKVQCACGQRYAFDVETTVRSMPYTVACPICGTDGPPSANEILAQSIQVQPLVAPAAVLTAAPPAPPAGIRLSRAAPAVAAAAAPAPTPAPARLLPGQLPRPQAELEARAKIFWGDPPEEVVKFLMRQSIGYADASQIVNGFFDERAAALRSDGIGKIVTGIGMVCVPIIAWAVFTKIGVLPIKLFALTVMVGLYGAYRLIKGTIMVISPRSETGDVASQ